VAGRELTKGGWSIIDKAKVGNMLGIFVPKKHRAGSQDEDRDMWAEGRFMIGELAETPEEATRKRRGTRIRGAATVKVFLPEEVEPHDEYKFPSEEVCRSTDGALVSRREHPRCPKKHYTDVHIHCIRGGGWDSMLLEHVSERTVEESGSGRRGTRKSRDATNLIRQLRLRRGGSSVASAGKELRYKLPLGVNQLMTQLDEANQAKYPGVLTE